MAMPEVKPGEPTTPVKGEAKLFSGNPPTLRNKIQALIEGERADVEWLRGEVGPEVLRRTGTYPKDAGATAEYIYWHPDIFAQVIRKKLEEGGRDALIEAQKVMVFVAQHPDQAVKRVLAPAAVLLWAASCTPAPTIPVEPTPISSPAPRPTEAPKATQTAPKPTATPGILAMPTMEAVGGFVPNPAERQALYTEADRKLAEKLPGVSAAKITAQLEGEAYQALGEATITQDGVVKTVEFLVKPDGSILPLGDKVKNLEWSFDASGTAVYKDTIAANLFGKVIEAKDYKDWSFAISDFGIVGDGGLPLPKAGFGKDQPLLVQVFKDPLGKITGIKVQTSPGTWADVDPKYFSRIKLTDQVLANAQVVQPTPTPKPTEKPTPKPTEIPQAPPERNFVTLMGTIDYSTFALGGTGSIVKNMYKGIPGMTESGIGIVQDGLFFHTNSPDGIGSIEPPTRQELDALRAGKPAAPLGARKVFGEMVYLKVQKSYWLDNGKFGIDFIDDQKRTISLLMKDNEVLTNFGYMALYIVPNEKASPGLVRPGDIAGYSNATEYLNQMKNILPGGKATTLDKTNNPNDPNSALIVVSMGGF